MDNNFKSFLDKIDINEGEILYIASDITKLLLHFRKYKKPFNPNELIEYFLNRIGKAGTLPIYSFAVSGKDREKLISLDDQSGWGPNSLFAYFHKSGAKNLFIGIDYKNGFTFDHYFEEKIGVDYRYFKYFESDYIDYSGIKSRKKYKMYVRDLDKNIVTSISPKLNDELLKKKGYTKYHFENIYFGLVNMKIAGDVMENDIIKKGGLIFAKKIT